VEVPVKLEGYHIDTTIKVVQCTSYSTCRGNKIKIWMAQGIIAKFGAILGYDPPLSEIQR